MTAHRVEVLPDAVPSTLDEVDPEWPWHRPGVFSVAPGVFRIPLPLPDPGLHSVNVYALEEPDGLVLVDAGQATTASREHLLRGLDALGRTARDVRRILVTHVHRDHYTQAVALRREGDLTIGLGRDEARSLALVGDPALDVIETQLGLLVEAGASSLVEQVAGLDDGVPRDLWEEPDTWLDETAIGLGTRTLDTIATPGHTRGHVVFRDEAAGLLFAGDHVLPHITPSIGFEPDPSTLPLGDYLRSLSLVRALPDTWLLPAHGHATRSVHRRVDELLAHHAERLEDTFRPVLAATATAFEVAGHLAWTRHRRRLDELSTFNRMLAVLETKAHLDLLVDQGRLRCHPEAGHDDAGVRRYAPA